MKDNSIPSEASVSPVRRRTIVAGAAWTIPVVTAAVAAPLAAASNVPAPVCPIVPTSSGWSNKVTTSGSPTPGVTQGWVSSTAWVSQADAAGRTANIYYIQFPYEQIAGAKYTFSFDVNATGGQFTTAPHGLIVTAGGKRLLELATSSAMQYQTTVTPDGTTYHYTRPYEATTTGPTYFQYYFVIPDNGGGFANHDLSVNIPTLTCDFTRV